MTIQVHPDPQEPAGGYAFLELPGGTLTADEAGVAVFDAYGGRWLAASGAPGARTGIGDPHWQQERFEFGPYPVYRHEGADWVRIGPEIVNKIEEYAPLKIEVSGRAYDTAWPDDVRPRAGAAVLGGLQVVARTPAPEDDPHLIGRAGPAVLQEPGADVTDELAADTVVPPPPQAGPKAAPARRGGGWLLLALLLLIAGGAAAWWYWPRGAAPEDAVAAVPPVATAPVPAAPVPAAAGRCTREALRDLGGFRQIDAAIRACGAEVSPDTALELVEEFAARGDADALFLFGTLYDGGVLDAPVEQRIGLTFEANDARAAEYYARAFKAGARAAAERLTETCTRLQGTNSTLARGAYDDFCG